MTNWELIQSKIISVEDAEQKSSDLREKGEKIVFTNGCFDIIHLGHINYLSKAADLGKLIIGVNADESVRMLNKGKNRPLQDEKARATILASLGFVENVVIFEAETPYDLIKRILPNILVKGGDYTVDQIVGHDIVSLNGGEVITLDLIPGYSTTSIEKKIKGDN